MFDINRKGNAAFERQRGVFWKDGWLSKKRRERQGKISGGKREREKREYGGRGKSQEQEGDLKNFGREKGESEQRKLRENQKNSRFCVAFI